MARTIYRGLLWILYYLDFYLKKTNKHKNSPPLFPPPLPKTAHCLIQTIQAEPGVILTQNWVTIQERPTTCQRHVPNGLFWFFSFKIWTVFFPKYMTFFFRIKYFGKHFYQEKAILNFWESHTKLLEPFCPQIMFSWPSRWLWRLKGQISWKLSK